MDKIDQLFVRACKQDYDISISRLYRIYKRFYLNNKENHDYYIAGKLSQICDDCSIVTTSTLLSDMYPDNYWKFGIEENDNYWLKCLKILRSKIALTRISKFGRDFQKPLRFKQLEKKT